LDFDMFGGGFGENSPRAPYLPVLWKNRRDYETSLLKVSREEFRQKKATRIAGTRNDANRQRKAECRQIRNDLMPFVQAIVGWRKKGPPKCLG
jgi:hypothetical protein